MNDLLNAGFIVREVKEPIPSEDMLKSNPSMKDELRRPMFLLISSQK